MVRTAVAAFGPVLPPVNFTETLTDPLAFRVVAIARDTAREAPAAIEPTVRQPGTRTFFRAAGGTLAQTFTAVAVAVPEFLTTTFSVAFLPALTFGFLGEIVSPRLGDPGGVTGGAKVAVTDRASLMETWQVPVPEQAPDQPVKLEPPVGVAVNVTDVPSSNSSVQSVPQLIPEGVLDTDP